MNECNWTGLLWIQSDGVQGSDDSYVCGLYGKTTSVSQALTTTTEQWKTWEPPRPTGKNVTLLQQKDGAKDVIIPSIVEVGWV